MRTLCTTNGRSLATDDAHIEGSFAACQSDGLWLDIEAPDDADFRLLEQTFKFHALTIEDIRHQNQRPKVDEYPDYNFVVIFAAEWQADEVASREHHLYVAPSHLITGQQDPTPS